MADEQASAGLTPKLVDSLYVEAMLLADEARSYFDACGRDDRLSLDPVDRVGFSCESLKVTTRLMHIIAWLLTQKAVAAGEVTRAQAGISERRLGDAPATDAELLTRTVAALGVGAGPVHGVLEIEVHALGESGAFEDTTELDLSPLAADVRRAQCP